MISKLDITDINIEVLKTEVQNYLGEISIFREKKKVKTKYYFNFLFKKR